MKQLLWLLFVSLLAESWLSLEAAHRENLGKDGLTPSLCSDGISGKTCFKAFLANISHTDLVRRSFKEASNWCKLRVPGSSLIVINSIESQRIAESFIRRQVLANETIIMDARKLSDRNSLEWSWVNGQSTLPIDVRTEQSHDGACVELKRGHSLAYCTGYVKEQYSYICEYSDSKSAFSQRQSNKSYIAIEGNATWYEARKNCLKLGGDLASIANLRTIENLSQLKENQRYWIGFHRNKWIWNSTGAAITYTDWDCGYPEESSDKQCICINPRCRRENNRTMCLYDRKWRTCNCNHSYTIVCQKEEKTDVVTTKIVATERMLPSTSTTRRTSVSRSTPKATTTSTKTPIATTTTIRTTSSTKTPIPTTTTITTSTRSTTPATSTTTSTKTPIVTVPTTTTTSTKITRARPTTPVTTSTTATITPLKPIISSVTPYTTTIAGNTAGATEGKSFSFSSMKPSNQTTASESSPSTGLFKSFTITEIFLILFLFVTVVFIVFIVILVIRKCKKRNERRLMKKTKQEESVSPEYETMVPDKRPSDDIVPIYTELELTQHPTPSNSTIYANAQPTGEAVDIDINVVNADPHEV